MKHKFLIACGGTGGHVFPAVALAEGIKKDLPEAEILFAGVFKGGIAEILKNSGYTLKNLKARAMPRGFNILVLPFIFKTLASLFNAFGILKKYRPDVVVSMGSFSGGPFAAAAKFMRLPVLIHEQNVVPGRANRLSAYFADRIAVSFEKTRDFFPQRLRQKVVCTGNPVRKEIAVAKKNDSGKFTILVMGGSQGAHRINEVFVEVAGNFDKKNFRILHFTGSNDFEFVNNSYLNMGIDYKAAAFCNDMASAYAESDLVICRSGATSISEIVLLGLVSILVPYPYGDCHQRENANVLKNANAAIIIEEDNLTKDILSETIIKISSDKNKLDEMRRNSRKLATPDAADILAKEVLALAEIT